MKQYTRTLWQSVLFWTIAMAFFAVFRYYGIFEDSSIKEANGLDINADLRIKVMLFALSGFLMGVIYANIEFGLEKYFSKRFSMGFNIFLSTFLYFLFIVFISTFVRSIANTALGLELNIEFGWWRNSLVFRAAIIYTFIASIVFSFIKIANDKFGKGVFLKMLFGKYREPKEEKRIFMFLDLKSSTTYAEELGHLKYSQLIQDCFLDLNEVVPKYDAEIYQYVGDEAVISWPYKKGLVNNNCVELFFAFTHKLHTKKEYYMKKYGVTPIFKAGLHGGTLMVAEVGIVKKELAYHGDVINTSARIQSECNTYKVSLLISEKLLKNLKIERYLSSKFLGKVLLKGKHNEVSIHTISKV
ncbi:adenylate/guanylate cyclase domain-containing protein [Flavivirga aquimarina]|uniref:Adenylate/guanylate cyclase domain-containing protein n=1 Tax=Flavivirga aquimarina TaxID=2027862 RepID=A0ABT8WAG9_9FLAO|nr:adenylate/guanylate cyclase domain-containing protein [Flavivirga aquimarina]MDO5970135.1 adenylate/guanylate cyclase domain-containing protein [Flavivirga aquimarina]